MSSKIVASRVKIIGTAALAFAGLSGMALASDLPQKASDPVYKAPMAVAPMWTGFYAGLNIGNGWSTNSSITHTAYPLVDNLAAQQGPEAVFGIAHVAHNGIHGLSQNGVIGGAQFGYNHQATERVIFGFELDFQGSGISGQGGRISGHPDMQALEAGLQNVITSSEVGASINWLGTARTRLGYLLMPNLMAFGTAGLAYGGVESYSDHLLMTSFGQAPETPVWDHSVPGHGYNSGVQVGWTAGGGAEWMFAPNWSLKGEALYYYLGGQTITSSPLATFDTAGELNPGTFGPKFAGFNTTRVNYEGVFARAGLNYHFDLVSTARSISTF